MSKVCIIGGGAAGLMAAISAGMNGHKAVVFEKNPILGKKLRITGKGRCNVTNVAETRQFVDAFGKNGSFLYSAFSRFGNDELMQFFEENGLPLKVERGGRVFPESDSAKDVADCLIRAAKRAGAELRTNCAVEMASYGEEGGFVVKANGRREEFDAVIITTGGLSYPGTGSTGDGYRIAKSFGHTVTKLMPSLVPFITKEPFSHAMPGLSLRNVELTIKNPDGKVLGSDMGEMLFTHEGISGPIVLSLSARIKELPPYTAHLDLKPALDNETLDARILRDFGESPKRQFKNSLSALLPRLIIPQVILLSGIDPEKPVNTLTHAERESLIRAIKDFTFTVTGRGGYDEAIVTRGGVNLKEVTPATMESRFCPGLYFAGEVLDLDAVTGGYNLQAAFSTGYIAGELGTK